PQKQHAEHLAYSNGDEDFYFPSKKHTLSQSELKKIKEHFSASYDVRGRTLKEQDMDGYGQKMGIILDLNGLEEIKTNYLIMAVMYVDKWANFPKRKPEFIPKVFSGNVEYYLVYEFDIC
ncbi:11719_t:CDS:2, partial [Funneliformis geosporum]